MRDLRKIRNAELVAVAHDHGAIHRVLELADIAGPIELRQVRHRLAADAGNGAIFLGAEPRQEVPQQMRDVFAARCRKAGSSAAARAGDRTDLRGIVRF